MKRGVIATPAEFEFSLTGFNIKSTLSRETLAYYLLYWDEIVIPDHNLISVSSEMLDQLCSLGCVYRPFIKHRGSFFGNEIAANILREQSQLASLMHKDPHVDWVLHQTNSHTLATVDKEFEDNSSLRLKLTNLLPLPNQEVPFEELLEFKVRYADEFREFHALLDGLYLEILDSPDRVLSERVAMQRLKSLVDDLEQITSNQFGVLKKFDIEASYNLSGNKLIGGATGGSVIEMLSSLTSASTPELFTSALLGSALGAVSGFNIKVTRTKKPTQVNDKARLSFLARASDIGLIT